MKYTFIITITFACLCTYINGQFAQLTTAPPQNGFGNGVGGTGYGGGNAGYGGGGANGFNNNNNQVADYGYTSLPNPTFIPGSSDDDNSIEDSTTIHPNDAGDGANAQSQMSGGGQFAVGFVVVLLIVGGAVLLVFLVRRKRAQALRDQQIPATSA